MPAVIGEWQDRRSGPVGCLAGNIILSDISKPGETFHNVEGTIFASEERVVVGRICSQGNYILKENKIHFCNISKTSYKNLRKKYESLEIYYLFITVLPHCVHYWLIPYDLMGKILSRAKVKSDNSSMLYTYKSGEVYSISGIDISEYHRVKILNPSLIKPTHSHVNRTVRISFRHHGRQYNGVLRKVFDK